jgi:glutamate synthase domain-containing protein 2
MAPQVKLETPFLFAPMSYGALSLNAHKAMAAAAKELGIVMNTGEGGLHEDIYPYRDNVIVQCASGRFGVHSEYLNAGVAVEIKIGQGAKPGIGGHLPGEKVGMDISKTRMIPQGTDALSPAPHHDIYSIEDLRQLIYALKEATGYKPVSVKIATVHNVAAIASGIVRAGADIVYLDGARGGTGAAPTIIRDHLGIPIEQALAAVDDRLRQEGIRHMASLVAAGGIRSSADAAKAIALGADAVALGTAALIAMGCRVCGKCYTGKCSWGITTQKPELTRRLDPEIYAERLYNLITGWSHELKEILGALGLNAIESLRGNRERLRGVGLDPLTLDILGIKPAGR